MANGTQGTYEIDIEEVEFLRHGETPYLARVFKPRGPGPFPAVIDAHGGGWCDGGRANNDTINSAVARGGVVVAALDFRNPPEASYPGSVADINYGIRWLKSEATRFNSTPEMVGVMGTSSGGHLIVLAALKPDDPRYAAIASPAGAAFDAHVPYVVALWPVICPLSRYRMLKESLATGAENETWTRLVGNQERYWITEDAMDEGSTNFAVQRGDAIETPNMLYMQHSDDPLHPRANLETFVAGYRKAGGDVELVFFEGEKYDAIRSDPDSPHAHSAIATIVEFIHREAAAAGSPQARAASGE